MHKKQALMERLAFVLERFCDRLEADLRENQRLLEQAESEVGFRKRMGYLLRFFSCR